MSHVANLRVERTLHLYQEDRLNRHNIHKHLVEKWVSTKKMLDGLEGAGQDKTNVKSRLAPEAAMAEVRANEISTATWCTK